MADNSDDICISINGVNQPVACGYCDAKVVFIGEANAERGNAGCVACNNIADIQDVANMAIQYAKDEGQMIVNRLARNVADKSKIMTFEGKITHDKPHRFIVKVEI